MARNFNKSNNPFMNENSFRSEERVEQVRSEGPITYNNQGSMTVYGAINKSVILTGILLVTAIYSYTMATPNPILMWGGAIGGLVCVLVASFKKELSPFMAPLYAALEGFFVGSITAIYAAAYTGIVLNAVSGTICVLLLMLMLYRSGLIKVTQKFRSGVIMATGAVLLIYVLNIVLSMFGINMPFLHEGGMIGIGISLVIIGIASMNLLLDFDLFEKGEQHGAPKYMEWFAGMALLITLVWLYVEILRLLSILSRD